MLRFFYSEQISKGGVRQSSSSGRYQNMEAALREAMGSTIGTTNTGKLPGHRASNTPDLINHIPQVDQSLPDHSAIISSQIETASANTTSIVATVGNNTIAAASNVTKDFGSANNNPVLIASTSIPINTPIPSIKTFLSSELDTSFSTAPAPIGFKTRSKSISVPAKIVISFSRALQRARVQAKAKSSPSTIPPSPCWEQAKEIFRKNTLTTTGSSVAAVTWFFEDRQDRVGQIIGICEELKSKVDAQSESAKGLSVVRLLQRLNEVTEMGDKVLECAPKTVSKAWSAIGLLLGVGINDLDTCDIIADACDTMVTVILTCRLFELQNDPKPPSIKKRLDSRALEKRVMIKIPHLLSLILDFSWHTHLHLEKNRLGKARTLYLTQASW